MSSDLKPRLQADLNAARKQRDKERTLLLSTTLSEVRNREIELGDALSDEEVERVIARAIKQRREAAEQMRSGKRTDLADKEDSEAALLSAYLPEPMSEDEVRRLVREVIAGGADAVGPLMGQLMPRLRGRFDGKEANRIAREELGR